MNKKNLVLLIGGIFVLLIYSGIIVFSIEYSVKLFDNSTFESYIALDSNGAVHVIYSNGSLGDSIDYCNNVGGSWSCEFVTFSGDSDPSYAGTGINTMGMALDSNDKVHLVYSYSHPSFYMAYPSVYCNNTAGSWSCVEVSGGGGVGSTANANSVAIDSNDKVYFLGEAGGTSGSDHLRVCNNTAGSWSCGDVYDDSFPGSIAIDSNDKVHTISSKYNGNVTYCNNIAGSWSCVNVTKTPESASIPLALDSNDKAHIAMADKDTNALIYCNNTGGSWSCISNEFYYSRDISPPIFLPEVYNYNVDLVLDENDKVHISSTPGYSSYWYGISYCNNLLGLDCIRLPISSSNIYSISIAKKKGRLSDSTSFSDAVHFSIPSYSMMGSRNWLFYLNISEISIGVITPTQTNLSTCGINFQGPGYCSNRLNNTIVAFNITALQINSSSPISCKYSLDDASNITMTSKTQTNFGIINSTMTQGNHSIIFYCNDSDYMDEINLTFFIDTINPSLEIITMTNNSNYSDASLDVNFTRSDSGAGIKWCQAWKDGAFIGVDYSCGNYTTLNWSEGNHSMKITVTDNGVSSQNTLKNSTMIFFTIDTLGPAITIYTPEEKNYANNQSINLNFSSIDAGVGTNSTWYKVINSSGDLIIDNTTISFNTNITFNLTEGDINYNLTLYSNDTLGNLNSTTVTFGIRTIAPAIVLDAPSNNKWLNYETNISFNFTPTDQDGIDTCELWGNWTGTWHKNYTWVNPTNATMNYTTLNISDLKENIWNIWCNDTLDNNGFALGNFTFSVDTINPNLTINSPIGAFSTSTPLVNITAGDINLDVCYYNVTTQANLGIEIVSYREIIDCSNMTMPSISDGSYYMFVSIKDLAGNTNQSNSSFSIDTSPSPPGGASGATTVEDEEEPKSFCGDGICQKPNDYGIMEDWWSCSSDCPGFNLDDFVKAFWANCRDNDDSTVCFWSQQLFAATTLEGQEKAEFSGQINLDTLILNCMRGGECFWDTTVGLTSLFILAVGVLALFMVKIPMDKKKVSIPKYFRIKIKKKRRK